MTDEEKRFDRREEARLDDMYDAQSEPEEEEDEMKPTQEQVIAWAREAGYMHGGRSFDVYQYLPLINLAYEAGRKDENEAIADAVSKCDARATPKGIAAAIRARREQ